MSKQNFYFSQSMLTKIANVSAATISRISTKLDMKNLKSEVRKKYDFSQARLILKQAIGTGHLIRNKTQVFFNFKGGTGKTTICHQVSVHMALLGFKVLAIDCDPQAHLTYALGVTEEEEKLTLYDVIVNKLSIKETIKISKSLEDIETLI
jgi:chromosome partitioning protein